jgi:hypothetical protein
MDPLVAAVKPPTPKPAAPVAPPVVEPVVTPVIPAAPAPVEPKPRGRTADEIKPGEKGYEKFEDRIARRVKEAEGKTAETAAAEKAAAEKAVADKAAADKAAAEKKGPDAELTDDAFKAQVEAEAKGIKDEKAARTWSDLRYSERALKRAQKDMVPTAKLTELETQLTEVRQQLETAKTAPAATPEEITQYKAKIEALEKRDAEREGELMVSKVERTNEFQNAVTKPRQAVEEKMSKLAKKYEISPRDLMAALSDNSDAQSDKLVELTEKMNRFDAAQVDNALRDLLTYSEKEVTLRSNAKEALEKVATKTQDQTNAQVKAAGEARKAAHGANWTALKEQVGDVLTPAEGDTDDVKTWNKAQTDAEVFARDTDFSALKPEVQSQVMQRASVHPLLMGKLQAVEAELKAANDREQAALKRVEQFEKAKPGNDANRHADDANADPAKGKTDFVERVSARFAAAGMR